MWSIHYYNIIPMANHATIIRATPVLIVDLQMNRVGSHCLEFRPNNKCTSSCALILYCYCKEQLSVLTCMNVQSCMKSQDIYNIYKRNVTYLDGFVHNILIDQDLCDEYSD